MTLLLHNRIFFWRGQRDLVLASLNADEHPGLCDPGKKAYLIADVNRGGGLQEGRQESRER